MAYVADLADTTQGLAWAARSSTSGRLADAMASAPLTGVQRPGAAAIAATRHAPGEHADAITVIVRDLLRARASAVADRAAAASGLRRAYRA